MPTENPRLFSYVVNWDGGLAPNPFWNWLTLAVCKPQIRRTALEGDLIVGLTPRRWENRLVYAMVVASALTLGEYYLEDDFRSKIPDMLADDSRFHVGDNFYKPIEQDGFVQLPSVHSNPDGTENAEYKTRDLSGIFVLAATEFYYWGADAKTLPSDLDFLRVGRGHRVITDIKRLNDFRRYLDKQEPGLYGTPKKLGEY